MSIDENSLIRQIIACFFCFACFSAITFRWPTKRPRSPWGMKDRILRSSLLQFSYKISPGSRRCPDSQSPSDRFKTVDHKTSSPEREFSAFALH